MTLLWTWTTWSTMSALYNSEMLGCSPRYLVATEKRACSGHGNIQSIEVLPTSPGKFLQRLRKDSPDGDIERTICKFSEHLFRKYNQTLSLLLGIQNGKWFPYVGGEILPCRRITCRSCFTSTRPDNGFLFVIGKQCRNYPTAQDFVDQFQEALIGNLKFSSLLTAKSLRFFINEPELQTEWTPSSYRQRQFDWTKFLNLHGSSSDCIHVSEIFRRPHTVQQRRQVGWLTFFPIHQLPPEAHGRDAFAVFDVHALNAPNNLRTAPNSTCSNISRCIRLGSVWEDWKIINEEMSFRTLVMNSRFVRLDRVSIWRNTSKFPLHTQFSFRYNSLNVNSWLIFTCDVSHVSCLHLANYMKVKIALSDLYTHFFADRSENQSNPPNWRNLFLTEMILRTCYFV